MPTGSTTSVAEGPMTGDPRGAPPRGGASNRGRGAGPEVFNAQNAESYGEWLGRRYRDAPNIIWILGGDRSLETETQKEVIRAMARGLRKGDGGVHLQTLHPRGGEGSSAHFHNDDWLDFNMRQNGHFTEFNPRFEQTRVDYDRTPIKPVLDGEPIYEDHPISFRAAGNRRCCAERCRQWHARAGR